MVERKEYVIGPRSKFGLRFGELWEYRELFYFFAWRDVKVKYKQTTLGILWVVLQPILTVVVFSLFFGRALGVPSEGLPYPIFVFSGLLLWTFFSSSINNASNSMISQAAIIKKIYFPRIIIPISVILASVLDLLVAFVVFIGALLYYQATPDLMQIILWWPVAFILMFVGTLGLSCWLAALVVKYRDFRYVVPFTLQLLLFLTPIIYPVNIVNQSWLRYLLSLNPMTGAIALFRMPLLSTVEQVTPIAISAASAVIFLLVGILYFKRTEDFFADLA